MRYDIIEFLKTFDDVNYPGDYRFERPAYPPETVQMKRALPGASPYRSVEAIGFVQ